MPPAVFISYSSDDAERALAVCAALEGHGVSCWMAPRNMVAGRPYSGQLVEAIRSSRVLLLVLTRNADRSQHVLREVDRAADAQLHLFALRLEDFLPGDDLGYFLGISHWLDAFTPPEFAAHAEKLAAALQILLPASAAVVIPAVHAAPAPLEAEVARLRADLDARERRERERPRATIVGLRFPDAGELFKDRTDAAEALRETLRAGQAKLVCLVGRAGIGKTALLSKVCAEIERGELRLSTTTTGAAGVDGILYWSCRGAERPNVGQLFDAQVGVGRWLLSPDDEELAEAWREGARSVAEKLRFLLGKLQGEGRAYLLVLDNFEDLLDETRTITDADWRSFVELCLSAPSALRIVATSRMEVAVDEVGAVATVFVQHGLPAPDALALLRDLDGQGKLGLREAPEPVLRKIVAHILGEPRALRLAARVLAKDRFLSVEELAENEALLTNLEAEGYERLREEETKALQALAVFGRAVPPAAVRYLLAPFVPVEAAVEKALRSLVANYFASYRRGRGSYECDPLDQEHAYAQIPDEGAYNKTACHARAAEFFAQLRKPREEWKAIADLDPQLSELHHRIRARQFEAAATLLAEIDEDYLARWGHYRLVIQMRAEIATQIADPALRAGNALHLANAYSATGELAPAMEWYNRALETADGVTRAAALLGQGDVCHAWADGNQADQRYSAALALFEELNRTAPDPRGERGLVAALLCLGRLRSGRENAQVAHELLERGLGVATRLGDERLAAWAHDELGTLALRAQHFRHAREHYEESRRLKEKLSATFGLAVTLHHLGNVGVATNDLAGALQMYERSLELKRKMGARKEESDTLHEIAWLHVCRSEWAAGIAKLNESLALKRALGDKDGEAATLMTLASTLLKQPQPEPAAALPLYEAALRLVEAEGDREGQAFVCVGLALAQRGLARRDLARAHLQRALALGADGRAPAAVLRALRSLAEIEEDEGRLAEAVAGRAEHIAALRETEAASDLAESLEKLAALHERLGRAAEAAAAREEAGTIRSRP